MRRKICELLFIIGIFAFLIALWTGRVVEESRMERLQEDTIISVGYREHNIGEDMLAFLKEKSGVGRYVGLYLLESKFNYEEVDLGWSQDAFEELEKKWKRKDGFDTYLEVTKSIWDDVKYFPVAKSASDSKLTVSYVNTWMSERSYGGNRGHEGTDIMASKNERGLYPIISMTDGTVTKKGWLEKGGYRIGITAPGGAYFYYAHLDSYANLEIGDTVKAGDILGFMGDSGYGEEGTVGQFAVHLHLGIYIYPNGEEISINPYWVLRYIENKKVKCYTEV